VSVHQLEDGRWIVCARPGAWPGDPNRTREYFGRGMAARAKALKADAALIRRRRQAVDGPYFVEIAAAYQKSRQTKNTPSTLSDLAWKLSAVILPALGDLPALSVNPEALDDFVANGRTAGRKATTIHRHLSIIKAVMAWGVEKRLLPYNPAAKYRMPKRDDAVIQPPTADETRRILAQAPGHLKRALVLSYYTGIRPGASELLALEWAAVDWDAETLFVVSAKKHGPPHRTVPVHPDLFDLLNCWYEDDFPSPGPIIQYKGKPVGTLKRSWATAKRKAGVVRRLRLYDLRHAAITAMLDAGGDLKAVSEIAGHASPETTLRIYQHTSAALRRRAAAGHPGLVGKNPQ